MLFLILWRLDLAFNSVNLRRQKSKDLENMNVLYKILKSKNYSKFVISYLHPMILAQNSILMITNSNSATLADFKYFGVPTIEYTHYSKLLLEKTQNKSIRPDWATFFINHDKSELGKCLKKIIVNGLKKNKKQFVSKTNRNLNFKLIERLNGNKEIYLKNFDNIKEYLN